jgi:hypothetical protein
MSVGILTQLERAEEYAAHCAKLQASEQLLLDWVKTQPKLFFVKEQAEFVLYGENGLRYAPTIDVAIECPKTPVADLVERFDCHVTIGIMRSRVERFAGAFEQLKKSCNVDQGDMVVYNGPEHSPFTPNDPVPIAKLIQLLATVKGYRTHLRDVIESIKTCPIGLLSASIAFQNDIIVITVRKIDSDTRVAQQCATFTGKPNVAAKCYGYVYEREPSGWRQGTMDLQTWVWQKLRYTVPPLAAPVAPLVPTDAEIEAARRRYEEARAAYEQISAKRHKSTEYSFM